MKVRVKRDFFEIFFLFLFFISAMITKSDLLAVQDKTNRHLRLREYLLEHSVKSDLVNLNKIIARP